HTLVTTQLATIFARPALHTIAEMSGGNPLHALEVARELVRRARGPTLEHLVASDNIGQLIEGRLRRLARRTRDALLVAAATSHPTIDHIDSAALAAAERAGIVRIGTAGHIVFAHPLYASAIYASCPPARRTVDE